MLSLLPAPLTSTLPFRAPSCSEQLRALSPRSLSSQAFFITGYVTIGNWLVFFLHNFVYLFFWLRWIFAGACGLLARRGKGGLLCVVACGALTGWHLCLCIPVYIGINDHTE